MTDAAPQGKRKLFSIEACAQRASVVSEMKIPRASQIDTSVPKAAAPQLAPYPELLQGLGNPSLVLGFDIETHNWPEKSCRKGHTGQFGKYTLKDDATLRFSRIVQIAWVSGGMCAQTPPATKRYYVRPEGFQIAARATETHHITQEMAMGGEALSGVLQEFMCDVRAVCDAGGRVVAHQEIVSFCCISAHTENPPSFLVSVLLHLAKSVGPALQH